MTKDALFTAIVVCTAADRYRRAGMGFTRGEQTVQVSQTQLDTIKADPRLKVLKVADAPAPVTQDAADTTAADDQAAGDQTAGDTATDDAKAADDQTAGDNVTDDAKAADDQTAGDAVTTDAKVTDTKPAPKAKAAKPKAGA